MRKRIKQILREEVSNKATKLIDGMLDYGNTNPKLDRWRKKFIDDEGVFNLALAVDKGMYPEEGSVGTFGDKYPDVPYKWEDGYGDVVWYKNGVMFRDGDKPAVVWNNGTEEWYNEDGKLHRVGKPAFIHDGKEQWYENGKLHRIGGPAHTDPERGSKMWFKHDKKHNEEGPAYSAVAYGGDGVDEVWYIDDKSVAHKTSDDELIFVEDIGTWRRYFKDLYDEDEYTDKYKLGMQDEKSN